MVIVLLSIIFICLTILMSETMYFEHKEKIAKLNTKNNPLNILFSGDKKDDE